MDRSGLIGDLQRRLGGFSICTRIAIGNAAIIAIGATAGIILSRSFPNFLYIILILSIVTCISASYWITHLALRPLRALNQYSISAGTDPASVSESFVIPNPDPETCQVARTIGDLIRQLESSNRQLKAVHSRSISAQEEERKRISRWLHDETSQSLATLILRLERLERQVPDYEKEICAEIAAAREQAARTLGELRKIIHGLRPSILDDLGLAPAIRWYARATLEEAGIMTTFHFEDDPINLEPEVTITLFRIAQEAINNVARHASASEARVTLRQTKHETYLAIEDDGRGFQVIGDPEEAIRKRHWGIIGIQERLERIGGTFNLISEPGKGTLLEVYVPMPKQKSKETIHEQKNPNPVSG